MSEKSTFYLVREEILPEAIKKTIKVKEILKRGEIRTINEAVEKLRFPVLRSKQGKNHYPFAASGT